MKEEKYGLVLEATVDKFKRTLGEAKKIVSSVKEVFDEAKTDFSRGFSLNVDETKENLSELRKELEKTEKDWENIKNAMAEAKGEPRVEARQKYEGDISKLKSYIEETENELNSVDKSFSGKLGVFFKNIKDTFRDAGQVIKSKFGKQVEETNEELDETGGKSKNVGFNLSGSFKNATKSLKRFALSLFGIQSIWRALSKASSTYISQNKELTNKMQGAWNALGTLIGPVVEFLTDIFMKLVGYINVVTKALFNFDIIAKANKNTMKKYAEQMKSFGGIDELTNLSNQEPQGLINEADLGLDDGIIKRLQDLSYWLKDNWDWLGKVLIAIGAVFGVSAVAGWLSNIGKLIGSASALTGLAGLWTLLGNLAILGTIAIMIKCYLDISDEDRKFVESLNQLDKLGKSIDEILAQRVQEAKKGKLTKKEINELVSEIQEEISEKSNLIKRNKDEIYSMNSVELAIAHSTGKYDELTLSIEENEDAIDGLIESYQGLADAGLLNEKQLDYLQKLLDKKEEIIKRNNHNIFLNQQETSKNYEELTRNDIENMQKAEDNFKEMATNVTNEATKLKNYLDENLNKEYKLKVAVGVAGENNLKSESLVSQLAKGSLNIASNLSSYLKSSGVLVEFKDIINQFIDGLNKVKFMGVSFNIPKLAVGTDLVRSEGLAYLHAGERVVPADVASGGYSGDGETNDLLRELIYTLENKQFSATIGEDAVGRASVNYIRNQNRIMGGSVI